MTPSAKAGGFSGNGTGNPHRLRLKAPSGPRSQMQDVQRGVQITSQNQATTGAVVHPLAKGLWDMLAAARTALRRAGWVHPDQRPPSFFRFGGQDRDELAPASVVNGLGQHRASQSLHLQVFDGDQPVLLHEHVRRLVVEVAPLIGDVDVYPRYFLTCLQPTPATLLASRQLALGPPQSPLSQTEVTLVGDLSPVAQDGERGQPHVDAYGQVGHWQRLRLGHLHAEANEPTASLALGGYRLHRRLDRQAAVPLELEIAHALRLYGWAAAEPG